ncbi:uncharacterized protein PHALS_02337 [Plasmopara halstedii]|uniref:Uncharacterized protein n=1 Tax=Plasmopara halstedii TaxID=4781 RepID=A0A0P1AV04_PLAHL|nr:uncharacterized protein PHALS_02337 [Plasmopara halstedii]CEG46010.1 hypothetical protein PHALS_02337 [Plasmopara halstedii]|eukprot:XP_024582379.1 hypothetical protein PHALS_02337 [Plasmopara halstedii]
MIWFNGKCYERTNSRLYHKQLDLSLMQRLQMADAGCDSRIKTADSKNNTRYKMLWITSENKDNLESNDRKKSIAQIYAWIENDF